MYAETVLNAVDLELQRTLAESVDGVTRGLKDLGWKRTAFTRDNSVIDSIWKHDTCHEKARAQTGTRGGGFFVGLIANFDNHSGASAMLQRIRDRIQAPLVAAGFELHIDENVSSYLWSDQTFGVSLSLLRRVLDTGHVTPSAVQFAIEPIGKISKPPTS